MHFILKLYEESKYVQTLHAPSAAIAKITSYIG